MMGKILFAEKEGVFALKFLGDVRIACGPTISNFLDDIGGCRAFRSVIIDLTEAECIDSTSLGMLAKIAIYTRSKFDRKPTIVSDSEDIDRILKSVGFAAIFTIITECPDCGKLGEMPEQVLPESQLRDEVLEAHRILMDLNENNRHQFKDLVMALEAEQEEQLKRVG